MKTRFLLPTLLLFIFSACTPPPSPTPFVTATLAPEPTSALEAAPATQEPAADTPADSANPLTSLLATARAATAVATTADYTDEISVASPDGRIVLTFLLLAAEGQAGGIPMYGIVVDGWPLILPSRLGFALKDAPPLGENMHVVEASQSSFDETWEQPWGETRLVRDRHNELRILLSESPPLNKGGTGGDSSQQGDPRQLVLVFRLFDDGVGFRYEVPEQPGLGEFTIMDELTEFAFADDFDTWSIPAFQSNRYEYLYTQSRLAVLRQAVHTPMTLRGDHGLYVVMHEAALVDYPSMTLKPQVSLDMHNIKLTTKLVPWVDGDLVRTAAPMVTPWRTLQIAHRAADLVTSYLPLNLNEPNKLGDVSWVQPGKYIGIWWGMHLDLYSWGSGPRHGATTQRTMEYIDFAAANGFRGVLVEGWNVGWDGDWTANGSAFKFTVPYPDFDLQALAAYAAQKGVRLIGHHETAAAIPNYEAQMGDAFALYQSLGIDTVKTGYVGSRVTGNQWHHGQFMVRHYQKVIDTAAQYHIMINAHEPIKDTGLRRTYPNFLSREGARGMEYDAWSGDGGNPPDHVPTILFTRLMAGPMDFTPGIFDLRYSEYRPNNQVNTTLAKQLAYYVIIYSPLQMAADLPENYVDQPAFQFIRDVPCDWETTVAIDGEIGDFAVLARQDRDSKDWYLGAITDEQPRSLDVALSFLEPGVTYTATLYLDGPGAHWDNDPFPITITEQTVTSADSLPLALAPGGGAAVRFTPVTP